MTRQELLDRGWERPRAYTLLREAGFEPVSNLNWEFELAGAPERTLAQARKKIRTGGAQQCLAV